MKEESLNSLRESDTVKESNFNIQIIIDQRETIERIIRHYEEVIETGKK